MVFLCLVNVYSIGLGVGSYMYIVVGREDLMFYWRKVSNKIFMFFVFISFFLEFFCNDNVN